MSSAVATNTEITRSTTAEEIVQFYHTDLSNKVAIVTGANSGIGLETARVLALVGAKVFLPCRTLAKAQSACDIIKEKNAPKTSDVVPMVMDLSDLSSIKQFITDFIAYFEHDNSAQQQTGKRKPRLDILINNAGVMGVIETEKTKDGFEAQLGINHLGHFYLTSLLLPTLKTTAKANSDGDVRIVNLSSSANYHFVSSKGLDLDNLQFEKTGYHAGLAYGQSKLANILHAKELQRRFIDEDIRNITVTSVHPGAVESNLGRNFSLRTFWECFGSARGLYRLMKDIIWFKRVQVGASTSVYCAVAPDVVKGEFYADNEVNRSYLNEQAGNQETAKKLYDISEKLISDKLK